MPDVRLCRLAGAGVAPSCRLELMLPREVRMRERGDFTAAIRGGRRGRSGHVVIHLERGRRDTRIGFIVSKAVGTAVVRNRVKRRLRHICREVCLEEGSHLVVRALPATARASSRKLRCDVQGALAKVQGS